MVNGSLSAGGLLPAPCVHTCDISHQHLSSPLQALQACVTVFFGQCESAGTATWPLRHKDFGQVCRAEWWGHGVVEVVFGGGMVGWWMVG